MTGIFAPFGAGVIAPTVTGVVSAFTGVGVSELFRRTYNRFFANNGAVPPVRNAAPPSNVELTQTSQSYLAMGRALTVAVPGAAEIPTNERNSPQSLLSQGLQSGAQNSRIDTEQEEVEEQTDGPLSESRLVMA